MTYSKRAYALTALTWCLAAATGGVLFAQDAAYTPPQQGETIKAPRQLARFIIRSTSKTLTFTYPLRGPHALNITGEYFRAASLPRAYYKMAGVDPHWKFYSYPLTFAYSYQLPVRSSRVLPVVAMGVTAHVTRAYRLMDGSGRRVGPLVSADPGPGDARYRRALGLGYGAEVSLGFKTVMSRHLFLLTQCRYRFVHSVPFDGSHQLGMRFGVLDFAVGAGVKL